MTILDDRDELRNRIVTLEALVAKLEAIVAEQADVMAQQAGSPNWKRS